MRIGLRALLFDGKRQNIPLEVQGTRLADALRAAQSEGFQIGYMKVKLNGKPINNPATGLDTAIKDGDIVHIEYVQKWELE